MSDTPQTPEPSAGNSWDENRSMNPRWPLPFGERPELALTASAGAIHLVPVAPGEQPRIEATGALQGNLRVEVIRDREQVRVHLGGPEASPFAFWDHGPNVRVTLFVPKNVHAEVRTDVGRIRADDLDGCHLQLVTSAGTMQLSRCRGRMALRTTAGKIVGELLSGSFDVETGAGAVKLGITGLDPGRHRVRSSVGAVRVDLAEGLSVQVETHTNMGGARNTYPSTAGALAVLEVSTELGAVKVRQRSAAEGATEGVGPHSRRRGPWGRDFDPAQWAEWFDMGTWMPPFLGRVPPRAPAPPPPPPPSAAPSVGDEELRRILSLLEQGKITAAEAEKLLRALERR